MPTNTQDYQIETNSDTERLWTAEDVADYLRLKPETVRIMARRKELPCIKVGRRVWRFKMSEISDWLMLQRQGLDGGLDESVFHIAFEARVVYEDAAKWELAATVEMIH